jgi:hypothetical protein
LTSPEQHFVLLALVRCLKSIVVKFHRPRDFADRGTQERRLVGASAHHLEAIRRGHLGFQPIARQAACRCGSGATRASGMMLASPRSDLRLLYRGLRLARTREVHSIWLLRKRLSDRACRFLASTYCWSGCCWMRGPVPRLHLLDRSKIVGTGRQRPVPEQVTARIGDTLAPAIEGSCDRARERI